jgi:hypothetical protein
MSRRKRKSPAKKFQNFHLNSAPVETPGGVPISNVALASSRHEAVTMAALHSNQGSTWSLCGWKKSPKAYKIEF